MPKVKARGRKLTNKGKTKEVVRKNCNPLASASKPLPTHEDGPVQLAKSRNSGENSGNHEVVDGGRRSSLRSFLRLKRTSTDQDLTGRLQPATRLSKKNQSSGRFREELYNIANTKENLALKCDVIIRRTARFIATHAIDEDSVGYHGKAAKFLADLESLKIGGGKLGMSVSAVVKPLLGATCAQLDRDKGCSVLEHDWNDTATGKDDGNMTEAVDSAATSLMKFRADVTDRHDGGHATVPVLPVFTPRIRFVNASGFYDTNRPISLVDLYCRVRTVNYDPSYFDSVVLTLPNSDCVATIFPNGKFIIGGANTIRSAKIAARHVLTLLTLCGFQPEIALGNFKLTNLTAVIDLRGHIDLNGLAEAYPKSVFMDTEVFPAAYILPEKSTETVHLGRLGLSFLVFATGKVVLTGGTSESHLLYAFGEIALPMMEKFCYELT